MIGSSEENLRRAIKIAEGVAPVVLWIDEIEKGLSGTTGSGETDGGTAARVFGALLTWMQEKTAPVFVVATANRIAELPPELLRKGRFDEIFFIDLPSPRERADIFAIHLRRRGRDPVRVRRRPARARSRAASRAPRSSRRSSPASTRRSRSAASSTQAHVDRGAHRDPPAVDHDARGHRAAARVGAHPRARGLGGRGRAMSRDRFSKLERRRPDQPDEPPEPGEGREPHASGRFGKIEPRKAEPASVPPDPFAPPPIDDSALEVREDDRREARQLRADHDAHTQEKFIAEAAALMLDRDRRDAVVPRPTLTLKARGYVAAGGMVAIAVLAQIVGPLAWGLAPILVIVLIAGLVGRPD